MASLPSFKPILSTWLVGISNHLNLQTFPLHAHEVVLSSIAYRVVLSPIAPVLSRWFAPDTYNKLQKKTQVNWDSRIVGLIQAVFISAKALAVIFFDPTRQAMSAHWQQRLWEYSPQAGQVQAYAAGYFLYDIWLSARYMHISGWGALIHGIAAFFVTMVGFRPFANYYGINFILYELSTPCLNIHWYLDKMGKTGSNLQLYNGLALMSTFFGCRLVWGSYQTWLLTRDMLSAWRTDPNAVPQLLFATYFLANSTLTILNFYWFGKMIEALRKRFEPKKKDE